MKVLFNDIQEFLEEARVIGAPAKALLEPRPIARVTWQMTSLSSVPWRLVSLVAGFIGCHSILVELSVRAGESWPHNIPDPKEAEHAQRRNEMFKQVETGLEEAGFEVRAGRYVLEEKQGGRPWATGGFSTT